MGIRYAKTAVSGLWGPG